MSVAGGPYIVENGLVMCLDAASQLSYPGTGTIWYDVSNNGNYGTLTNSPIFSASNYGSFSFNGTNQYININLSSTLINLYNSTTQFVVNLPLWSGGQRCILSYRGGAGGSLYIGKMSSGVFCYYNQLSNANYTVGSIADGATAHCAVTCDAVNNLLSVYINGNLAGSATKTGWVSAATTNFNLGYDNGGTNEYMLGNFYNFCHYNRVLTPLEILQNYNAQKSRFGLS
jgi:Concanavalin A-like lectin/glucanases superfamily